MNLLSKYKKNIKQTFLQCGNGVNLSKIDDLQAAFPAVPISTIMVIFFASKYKFDRSYNALLLFENGKTINEEEFMVEDDFQDMIESLLEKELKNSFANAKKKLRKELESRDNEEQKSKNTNKSECLGPEKPQKASLSWSTVATRGKNHNKNSNRKDTNLSYNIDLHSTDSEGTRINKTSISEGEIPEDQKNSISNQINLKDATDKKSQYPSEVSLPTTSYQSIPSTKPKDIKSSPLHATVTHTNNSTIPQELPMEKTENKVDQPLEQRSINDNRECFPETNPRNDTRTLTNNTVEINEKENNPLVSLGNTAEILFEAEIKTEKLTSNLISREGQRTIRHKKSMVSIKEEEFNRFRYPENKSQNEQPKRSIFQNEKIPLFTNENLKTPFIQSTNGVSSSQTPKIIEQPDDSSVPTTQSPSLLTSKLKQPNSDQSL
ncbi:hypothetical protein, no similarity [Maudiozyma saulgeensis]|uniref:Uncharacterized protein n=1 Tax=Maudiozyma saulgeensis TaxID=1789683 RepID=A0A1X7R9D1_9SACH|nr:hypothetical protein, no similarity [Kazachstania saulgeensis]